MLLTEKPNNSPDIISPVAGCVGMFSLPYKRDIERLYCFVCEENLASTSFKEWLPFGSGASQNVRTTYLFELLKGQPWDIQESAVEERRAISSNKIMLEFMAARTVSYQS